MGLLLQSLIIFVYKNLAIAAKNKNMFRLGYISVVLKSVDLLKKKVDLQKAFMNWAYIYITLMA